MVSPLGPTLVRAAWLSILLGLGIELILIAVAAGSGHAGQAAPFVADGVQKISWSVLVCAGLALGIVAGQLRESIAGVAGLFAAPLAFIIARAAHKSAVQALELPAMAAGGPSPLLLAGLKGLEYATLGVALCWIAKRSWGGLLAHAVAGALAGIVFGGTILWLTTTATVPTPTVAALLPRIVNELVFPVGCALVLYSAGALTSRQAP